MKYNDNGEYKDIYVKAFDTLPVGTEVDYDGSVVPSGWTEMEIEKIPITPTNCSNSSYFGNSYYYIDGNRVHIHLGLEGLTANTNVLVWTVPTNYRPMERIFPLTGLADTNNTSFGYINSTNGELYVHSNSTYALIDVDYWI